MKTEKLIGQKFGILTITAIRVWDDKRPIRQRTMAHCKCDCGKVKGWVRVDSLQSGKTISCGCLKNRGRKIYTTNTTGTRGVSYSPRTKLYRADIYVNRKRISLGSSKSLDIATELRRQGEEIHWHKKDKG